MGDVHCLPPGWEIAGPTVKRHPDGAAGALVALVCSAGQDSFGERVDDSVASKTATVETFSPIGVPISVPIHLPMHLPARPVALAPLLGAGGRTLGSFQGWAQLRCR